jgi:hypothetical protein
VPLSEGELEAVKGGVMVCVNVIDAVGSDLDRETELERVPVSEEDVDKLCEPDALSVVDPVMVPVRVGVGGSVIVADLVDVSDPETVGNVLEIDQLSDLVVDSVAVKVGVGGGVTVAEVVIVNERGVRETLRLAVGELEVLREMVSVIDRGDTVRVDVVVGVGGCVMVCVKVDEPVGSVLEEDMD